MIAVVDYGVGNLYSLTCSLRHIGADCIVTNDEQTLRDADRIILPGVGAFGDAVNKLREMKMDRLLGELIVEKGKPLMGICLGIILMCCTCCHCLFFTLWKCPNRWEQG